MQFRFSVFHHRTAYHPVLRLLLNPDNGIKISKYLEESHVCNMENEEDVKACIRYLRKFHDMLTLVKSELGLAFVPEPMTKELLARGELVELHLQEIIPSRSICLVYDHHRPLNTAARKFQQMLTKAEPGHPAAPKQAEGVSFISQ